MGSIIDKEVSATTTYDYGFRIYSPGLGRFLSVDPLTAKYANESPFMFVGGNPVISHDPDGRDRIISTTTIYDFGNGNVLSFVSKRIINEDFIISRTSTQNGAVHYLYMDTYEQHVAYYNVISGEEKKSSSVSYPIRFKSAYDTRKWTGRIGRKWEKSVDWFSNLMKDGYEGYHEGGGIMLASKIGEGTDRGAKRPFMDASPVDIDNIVATISQLKTTSDATDRTKSILDAIEQMVVSGSETGSNIGDLIDEIRTKISPKPKPVTQTIAAPPSEVIRDQNGRPKSWLSKRKEAIKSFDDRKPDTIRITNFKEPTN